MRALVIVALLSTAARADVSRRDLATALVKGDVATLKGAAQFPLGALGLWFDSEPCKRFTGTGYVKVTEDDLAVLVKCITDLGVTHAGDPDAMQFRYGAGTPLALHVSDGAGALQLRAIGGTAFNVHLGRAEAAPIAPDTFTAKLTGFSREVAPPAADRTRLDASSTLKAMARIDMCVDATGKAEAVKAELASDDVPGYAAHVEKIIRGWKTTPFSLRGKPVPACSKFTVGYPASRIDITGDLSYGRPPPPPPPMVRPSAGDAPRPPPITIAARALEIRRKSGNHAIAPTDMTKIKMVENKARKIVGTWKLCIAATGAVSTVTRLKSTGYPDYDTKIETEMAKWTYEPFAVNGKPAPVCTAVTFVYSQ